MFGDMVENSKPNPEIFLDVIQYFKVSQEETLVLEDSFYGVKAANNGNIDVIWIKDMVDIDQRGDVNYLYKFDNAYQAINTINNMIE
jgi:beta-phosphoglucomutase-like phosphatase (HAD superfamily)